MTDDTADTVRIPSVLGIPSREDIQNTESAKYHRLGQVKLFMTLLENHLSSYEALTQ